MRFLGHELLPPLIVDNLRDRIGKRASFWIAWSFGADRIALQHPAAAQLQYRIEASAQRIHFGGRARHHVRPAIRPASQQRAVLLEENAVVNE